MPVLVKSLLNEWWHPEFALAHARIGILTAEASGDPFALREWRRAAMWLRWMAGIRFYVR